MRCIIAGSRTVTLEDVIQAVAACPFTEEITEVVSGCARGADHYGEMVAEETNTPVKKFPAEWDIYGKRAGYIRNQKMAEYADAVIAVWDGKSNGTKDMIQRAKDNDLKLYIHYTDQSYK